MPVITKILRVIRSYYLRHKFFKCGNSFEIGKPFYLSGLKSVSIGNNVSIAKGAYLNCSNNGLVSLKIGNNVSIGRDV